MNLIPVILSGGAGSRHRLSNPGLVDLVLIEVQTGHDLGEDDIVRFQDAYDRNAAGEPTFGTRAPAQAVSSASQH